MPPSCCFFPRANRGATRDAYLIRALAKRHGIELDASDLEQVRDRIPDWLTPGAAEALAVKLYRVIKTAPAGAALSPVAALRQCLEGYRNPVPRAVMESQIRLAVAEASDAEFIPAPFREA